MDDLSFGIVPLQKRDAEWYVFMIRHQSGHWTLPKGHPEKEETSLQCAERELLEETNLRVVKHFSHLPPLIEKYQFYLKKGLLINKTVEYYIAEVEGEARIQQEELQDGRWLPLKEAEALASYPQMKELLTKVQELIGLND